MLRAMMKKGPLCAMVFPFEGFYGNNDRPVNIPKPDTESLPNIAPGEIAWYRLKRMFAMPDGQFSKELQSIISTTVGSTVVGFLMGGIIASRNVPENFMAENTATKFQNEFDARRQLQTKFTLEFGRGAFKFGARVGFFCFIFGTTATCLNVYRGKVELLNYMGGGALTGCLFKLNMGLKGIISGTTVGASLGGIYGAFAISILYLTGIPMDTIYETQDKWLSTRDKISREQIAEQMESEMPKVKLLYDINQQAKLEESEAAAIPKT